MKFVGVTEFPLVGHYLGQVFCTHGVRFDWHADFVTDGHLLDPLADFYVKLLREVTGERSTHLDPHGRLAYVAATGNDALIVASLPKNVKGRRGDWARLKRFVRQNGSHVSLIRENAASGVIRSATIHGITNYNAQILAACEVWEADPSAKRAIDIKKGCAQIRSILQAARVLAPSWRRNTSSERWNEVHRTIRLQQRTWEEDLRIRAIDVRIDDCHRQVLMDADILLTVFSNLFSNIIKYAERGSVVNVTFHSEAREFVIEFEMSSLVIPKEDVGRLVLLGERGRDAKCEGDGVGLALVKRAMDVYGGELRITPGQPRMGTQWATNVFALKFPPKLVREISPSSSKPGWTR